MSLNIPNLKIFWQVSFKDFNTFEILKSKKNKSEQNKTKQKQTNVYLWDAKSSFVSFGNCVSLIMAFKINLLSDVL